MMKTMMNRRKSAPEEFMDESNPFYAAKKALKEQAKSGPSKPAFKDTSDAASDILRRLMERKARDAQLLMHLCRLDHGRDAMLIPRKNSIFQGLKFRGPVFIERSGGSAV